MRTRRKIVFAFLLTLAVTVTAYFCLSRQADRNARLAVEKTRHELREQGFKLDLSEFNLALSPEMQARAAALTNAGEACRDLLRNEDLRWARPLGSNTALVSWREDKLATESSEDAWPELRKQLAQRGELLDRACQAVLSGPIRFQPVFSLYGGLRLPYLADMQQLASGLATRTVLELHDGHQDRAWTNLLALTRLVTAWNLEPVDISHLVRFACAAIAEDATWEALQNHDWTDEQLAALQREWESADFFNRLPETAALSRASMTTRCQQERKMPLSNNIPTFREGMRNVWQNLPSSPRDAWRELIGWPQAYVHEIRYRQRGSYEDENLAMLYFRERERELRKAVTNTSWQSMRSLPGVTNIIPFQTATRSRMQAMINLKMTARYWQSQGKGLLGLAAESEARRRIILTAIALEHFRRENGSYPQSLDELVPRFLGKLPIDFMDGQPLRYRRNDSGHFVLYSTGVDCQDDGGNVAGHGYPDKFATQGFDLVWPSPAVPSEVESFHAVLEIVRKLHKGEQVEIPENIEIPRDLRERFMWLSPPYPPAKEWIKRGEHQR